MGFPQCRQCLAIGRQQQQQQCLSILAGTPNTPHTVLVLRGICQPNLQSIAVKSRRVGGGWNHCDVLVPHVKTHAKASANHFFHTISPGGGGRWGRRKRS